MRAKRRLSILFAAMAAACALSAPAYATFPGAKRCYAQPGLRPTASTLIAELSASLSDMRPPEDKACEMFARGLLYHTQGKIDLAIADYSSAIGWMHDFPAAYAMRGDAYEDLGEHEKANADYAEAAKIQEDAAALENRCWARAVRGHPLDRALDDCNESLKQQPNNGDTLASRCFVYYRLRNYPAAIADCDAALKLKPKGAAALYMRGLAKLKSGDAAAGYADIDAAKALFPKAAEYYALWDVKP